MSIQYFLRDYALTEEPDDFIAVIVTRGTADLQHLAQEMIAQGSPLSLEEILETFKAIQRSALALLDQGYRVTGPLTMVTPHIQGTFYSEYDEYDPQQHKAQLIATPTTSFEQDWQTQTVFCKVCQELLEPDIQAIL